MVNRRQRLQRTGVALLHYEKMFGSALLSQSGNTKARLEEKVNAEKGEFGCKCREKDTVLFERAGLCYLQNKSQRRERGLVEHSGRDKLKFDVLP